MLSPCYQIRFLILLLTANAVAPSLPLRQAADQARVLVEAAVRPSLFSEAAYSATLPANSTWSSLRMR
jgi:hypothetical protein